MSLKVRRFDLLELIVISAFMTLAGASLVLVRGHGAVPYSEYLALKELGRLKGAYGPGHFSEDSEEWMIRDFFKDARNGLFVDVGAFHYANDSTTYYLEKFLGWSGVAIDAQATFEADYRRYRPRTRFFALFVSDVSDESATLYLNERIPLVTSASRQFTEFWGKDVKQVHAPTITLNDLLDRLRVGQIDFLSMDIELSEPKALAGFDIDRFKPRLVRFDDHPEVRQEVLDYMTAHRYAAIGRYLRADRKNLYFRPLK